MTNLMKIEQNLTMTSREIAELTGKQHKDVLYDIRKMLEDLELTSADFSADLKDSYGRTQPGFALPKRETLILVSGYNLAMRAKIIDRWQELEAQVAKPMTQIELILASATMLAEMEKRQTQIEHKTNKVENKLVGVESSLEQVKQTNLLTTCPSNAESITAIRERMNKEYGLSSAVVDTVMRQSLYAPKPCGMVRNQHENSGGNTYAVYWKKDISAVFKMFVQECKHVSANLYKHPFMEDKKFKIVN